MRAEMDIWGMTGINKFSLLVGRTAGSKGVHKMRRLLGGEGRFCVRFERCGGHNQNRRFLERMGLRRR